MPVLLRRQPTDEGREREGERWGEREGGERGGGGKGENEGGRVMPAFFTVGFRF